MARIRTIKPEFCTSEQIAECSANARLLFVLMWCFCDDGGVHPDSAKRLKMECFPADDVTAADVSAWVDELIQASLLERYTVAGQGFLRVTGWSKHQKIDQPTYKFPQPDGSIPSKARRGASEHSANVRLDVAERSPPEGNGKERKGVETSPQSPPDRIDDIRRAVWRLSGLSEDQINTKLTSTSAEGLRQSRLWLERHSADDILAAIARAFDDAERRGESIRRPWPYLDQVMADLTPEAVAATIATGLRGWKNPETAKAWMDVARRGWWTTAMGPQPGNLSCDAPPEAQEAWRQARLKAGLGLGNAMPGGAA